MGRFIFVSFGLLVVFLSLSGTGADCNPYWSTYEGRSYRFFKTPKNWEDAERFCSEEVNGGHLVSIESDGEADFVIKLVTENKHSIRLNVWIGMRVQGKEKQCSSNWSDGSSISYENWSEAELKTCIGLEEDSDSTQCSSLSRSSCVLSLSSGVLAVPASLVSSANLMSPPSIPSSRPLMKMLKSTGPRTEPWGTPLHTSLHVDAVPLRTTC